MKLALNINYRTQWGESLYVGGGIAALGNNDPQAARPMTLSGTDSWSFETDLPESTDDFEYFYVVRRDDGEMRREWGTPHRFVRGNGVERVIVFDHWQDMPYDKPYYSSAFLDCINKRDGMNSPSVPRPDTITIRVSAPMVKPDESLALIGSSDLLGAWNPAKSIRMSDHNFPEWEVTLDRRMLVTGDSYKFIIVKRDSNEVVAWETCDNRVMDVNTIPSASTVIAGLRFAGALSWRGAGTAIPVFSIRTNDDFGVGDFYDLMKMADWAASTGQTFLQILPINDTTMTHTWTDSYPYNANSTFALHPMYMRLEAMGQLNDPERRAYYAELGRKLNALPEVDYEQVNKAKNQYFREIYAQNGEQTVQSDDFRNFMKLNAGWIENYAVFCVLRDRYGTADFTRWPELGAYNADDVRAFIEDNRNEINYVCYIQYHLCRQMNEVIAYAHSKGVAIKGDIPIGISRTSVDAWTDSRLFNMDCQAGAPPDDFSVLGQNWGFPTYNWEEMNKDGFAWWKSRFRKMSEYFDAYRIDHVLGFFRIWQIPMTAIHGLLGYFNPAMPFSPDELRNNYDFWIDVDLQTKPFIMDHFLHDFFGEYTDEVRESYLEPLGNGRYRLKVEFDNQRKVADHFAALEKSEKNNRICNALLGLIDQVLFIEDPVEKGKYHPRISAQYTYIYRSLNDYERWCFDRLYNDFFYHRHNDFWYGKAMWKLPPLIDATDMLCCAEDLGMIPDCVPAVMHALEILSLEIQRMPKDPQAEFGDTWHYPYYSVCTTSTHDMGGIRQWWEENREKTQHFFNNVLHQGGEAPRYCEPWIARDILDLHLKSPSMLCIIPLQDYLAMDGGIRRNDPREEQINVPANSRHYWRYRMHLTVEELASCSDFNIQLRDMIVRSGR